MTGLLPRRTAVWCLVFCSLTALTGSTHAADGDIVARRTCDPSRQSYLNWITSKKKEYEQEVESARTKFAISSRDFAELKSLFPDDREFHRRRNAAHHTCERITYLSDGLKVIGYIWRPSKTRGKSLPLLIYNRGGGQELGRLTPTTRDGFFDFLEAGFVVIGSQYRGNDGGDGHDEEGGAETNDVLSLVPLAQNLGYVDTTNVFMLGESRGGMTTFLAMKRGAALRAAAVVGAETDLAANLRRRPELEADNAKQIPGYRDDPGKALRERSAQAWPSALNAPLLILHGGKDWRVTPLQALGLADKLVEFQKPFELTIYGSDDHSLSFDWRERDRRIIDWFKKHLVGSVAPPSPKEGPLAKRN